MATIQRTDVNFGREENVGVTWRHGAHNGEEIIGAIVSSPPSGNQAATVRRTQVENKVNRHRPLFAEHGASSGVSRLN